MLMTKAEYAVHRNVDPSFLSKKKMKALLAPAMEIDKAGGASKINQVIADKILAESLGPAKKKKERTDAPAPQPGSATAAPVPNADAGLVSARRDHEVIKLENARIDLEEKKGNLIYRADAEAAAAATAQTIREKLVAACRTWGETFSTKTDAREIKATLETEIKAILEKAENDLAAKLRETGRGNESRAH